VLARKKKDTDFLMFEEWIAGTNPAKSASHLRRNHTDRRFSEFTASAESEFTVQFTTTCFPRGPI
jgi:hypothetical protein